MTRYSIDTDGVSRERRALADDPAELRGCASALAVAAASAMSAAGSDACEVRAALDRFRTVHVHAFDALADAADALGDRLGRSAAEGRAVELTVSAALSDVAMWAQARVTSAAPW